jgi:integrase
VALGPPKTAASVRTVPLPEVINQALAEHLPAFGTGPDGLLFVDDDELPLLRPRFSRHVWRLAVTAVEAILHETGMHELRHFYTSLLIRHGEPVKTVQARLGHATAAETLDTYSHLWPDADNTTRTAADSALKIDSITDTVRTKIGH